MQKAVFAAFYPLLKNSLCVNRRWTAAGSPRAGEGDPPHLPAAVRNLGNFRHFCTEIKRKTRCFVSFLRIAKVMRSLQIVPILCRRACRTISKLPPLGNRAYLIYHKAQRMCRVAGFVVVDRPEPPMADTALAPHSPQPCPVLAPQTAVGIAGVVFGWVVFHVYPPSRLLQ